MIRQAVTALALVAVALLVMTARVWFSSREELREGEARLLAGDAAEALDHLGQAARLDAPGNPFARRALDRLVGVAAGDEQRGDATGALAAWREVRSALRATRSALPRDPALAARADDHIARLAAALESPSVDPSADEGARMRWHRERLLADDSPSPLWSLLAIAGAALWIGSAFALFARGLDERLRFRRSAVAWAAGIALGFALFLVGLARA